MDRSRRKILTALASTLALPFSACSILGSTEKTPGQQSGASDEAETPTLRDDPESTTSVPSETQLSTETATPEQQTISEQFDCAKAERPAPDVDAGIEHTVTYETAVYESVGAAEYPPVPSESGMSPAEWALEHEKAYQRNVSVSNYGDRLFEFSLFDTRSRLIQGYNSVTVVRLDFHVAFEAIQQDGGTIVGDFPEAAVYGVDETGVVRAETDFGVDSSVTRETPDPIDEGNLVVCFET